MGGITLTLQLICPIQTQEELENALRNAFKGRFGFRDFRVSPKNFDGAGGGVASDTMALDCRYSVPTDLSIPELKNWIIEAILDRPPSIHAVSLIPDSIRKRTKKLAVFDMDSTLINEEVIDEMAGIAKRKAEVARITEQAMGGEIDFKKSLELRLKAIGPLSQKQIAGLADRLSLSPGAKNLVGSFRQRRILTAILSGGFQEVIEHFLQMHPEFATTLKFANRLKYDSNQQMTGEIEQPCMDAEQKKETLVSLQNNQAITSDETMVVGDGHNDRLMMAAAGTSVAFCAKPALLPFANAWVLNRNMAYIEGFLS